MDKRKLLMIIGLLVAMVVGGIGTVGASENNQPGSVTETGAPSREENSSGHLVFVKRLSDGTYVPTSFSLFMVVFVAVFLLIRKKRRK
jgi:hypothetical protein